MPRLTIGMPLYNNARTLPRALHTLRKQTFSDFRVLMSDDGSRDETVAIARAMVEQDARFELVEQPINLNYGNFRFVLHQADSELFMFAAGDDWWEPTFAEECIRSLDLNADAVAAVSLVRYSENDPPEMATGTFELTGVPSEKVVRFLRAVTDNSRMYGVFRLSAARPAFPAADHHAYDWTFSCATLLAGDHIEVPRILMHREMTPSIKYVQYARRDAKSSVDRLFPLGRMSVSLLFEKHIPLTVRTIRALLWANLRAHGDYVREFHPRYYRLARTPIQRLLARV